jgi:outer membrane protein TolC
MAAYFASGPRTKYSIPSNWDSGAFARIALGLLVLSSTAASAAAPLDLEEAVSIAIGANDPTVARFDEKAAAFEDWAISDSQLPDPQLRVGLANMPTDTFNFDQEPMTQAQVGLRQQFPRGRTLSETRGRRAAEATGQRAAGRLQELQIALQTRSVWLDLFYWYGARATVAKSRQAVEELTEVVQSSFSTGLGSNQDLLRAELELGLLDDRGIEVERQIDTLTAEFARLVGAASAERRLPSTFPALPTPPAAQIIEDGLLAHPAVEIEDARVDVADRSVSIARQQYLPGWSLDVGYGARSGGRADFASAMVVFDMPLFTGNRQDRRLSAAQSNRSAARLDRSGRLLDLKRQLARTQADWTRLRERETQFANVVLQRATANADAALEGYQAQVVDFAELIRSRLTELDTRLQIRRLKVDRAKAQAQLLFLAGEKQR